MKQHITFVCTYALIAGTTAPLSCSQMQSSSMTTSTSAHTNHSIFAIIQKMMTTQLLQKPYTQSKQCTQTEEYPPTISHRKCIQNYPEKPPHLRLPSAILTEVRTGPTSVHAVTICKRLEEKPHEAQPSKKELFTIARKRMEAIAKEVKRDESAKKVETQQKIALQKALEEAQRDKEKREQEELRAKCKKERRSKQAQEHLMQQTLNAAIQKEVIADTLSMIQKRAAAEIKKNEATLQKKRQEINDCITAGKQFFNNNELVRALVAFVQAGDLSRSIPALSTQCKTAFLWQGILFYKFHLIDKNEDSLDKAIVCFELCEDNGYAQLNLGRCHVLKSILYLESAEQTDDPQASTELELRSKHADELAFACFDEAAHTYKIPQAFHNLADCYEGGIGVPEDKQKAFSLLLLAQSNGDQSAGDDIQRLMTELLQQPIV